MKEFCRHSALIRYIHTLALLAVTVSLAGCPSGSGEGLDESGPAVSIFCRFLSISDYGLGSVVVIRGCY